MKFKVESVNVSELKSVQKHSVEEIELVENHGIKGDAHTGNWHRQVSLLADEAVDLLRKKNPGMELKPGAFGENILTRGIDRTRVKIGGSVVINGVVMEVTQIGKVCHDRCAIYDQAGECIMPSHGIFTRVLKGGKISAEDSGYYRFG
ncbi:MAG: MOSC domain-containing protein [Candidatus Aminicenantes bacterium]|nr:MOSC domain-containing protein [Candidatus Aminicenantes bacterium]